MKIEINEKKFLSSKPVNHINKSGLLSYNFHSKRKYEFYWLILIFNLSYMPYVNSYVLFSKGKVGLSRKNNWFHYSIYYAVKFCLRNIKCASKHLGWNIFWSRTNNMKQKTSISWWYNQIVFITNAPWLVYSGRRPCR